ncbi:MAG: hypothetical protein AAGC85_13765 [Bacteroidota bacterium]
MNLSVKLSFIALLTLVGCYGTAGFTPEFVEDSYVRLDIQSEADGFFIREEHLILISRIVKTHKQLDGLYLLLRIPLNSLSEFGSDGQEYSIQYNGITAYSDKEEELKLFPSTLNEDNALNLASEKYFATDSVLVESVVISTDPSTGTNSIDGDKEAFETVFAIQNHSFLDITEAIIDTKAKIREIIN